MQDMNNPYASPSMDADNAAAEHCLLVNGNVKKINAFLAQRGIDVR